MAPRPPNNIRTKGGASAPFPKYSRRSRCLDMNLRDGEPAPQVPDAVRSKLTRRLVSLITLLITLSMVYAAAWAPPTDTVHVASVNASASNWGR